MPARRHAVLTTLTNMAAICQSATPQSNTRALIGKRPVHRTGFIDQSEARATRQAPSIRVHHAGHAAHYILHLIHVLLWLAAFLSRMPLDRRETRDW
uniref:Secreted protein n=1 Tax=Mesocestoides corti TaxID=53468 RepID=A0A5K3G060_MESCO